VRIWGNSELDGKEKETDEMKCVLAKTTQGENNKTNMLIKQMDGNNILLIDN